MKNSFCAPFAGEKLDVVDQRHVNRPVALAEVEDAISAPR
jgi:hypothetical protein